MTQISPPAARAMRALVVMTLLGALSGCAALGALQTAAAPLESYELTPLPASGAAGRSGLHLRVELPAASGALASDRIVIKPNPLQVQNLPEVRWVDDANTHVQMLLMRSLAGTGRFGLVTGDGPGPLPDLSLLSDLEAFQAEIVPPTPAVPQPTQVVRVGMTLSVFDERSNTVRATRRFEQLSAATSTQPIALVAAFDQAMTAILRDAAGWVAANSR